MSNIVNHAALLQSGLQVLKDVVKSDKAYLSLEDGDKRTVVHVAASQGHLEALQWILKSASAADLKKKDRLGCSALHLAVQKGHLGATDLLLRRGCSPNSEDRNLASPFVYFCKTLPSGTLPIPKELLSVLELFVERGADVDSQDATGDSPLHNAAANGRSEVVRFLLQNFADPNLLNASNETPLHQAVRCKEQEASLASVRLLLENGANPSYRAPSGSALTLAYKLPNVPAAFLLKGYENRTLEIPPSREAGTRALGPSYDNLQLLSLLSITKPQEYASPTPIASQFPVSEDIMAYNEGFRFELGGASSLERSLPAELALEKNFTLFDYKECSQEDVTNIMGVYITAAGPRKKSVRRFSQGHSASPDASGPTKHYFCISVLKLPENGKLRCIIRTSSGDHRFFIPAALFKGRVGSQLPGKDILKELVKEIPELDLKGISKSVVVENPALHAELVNFEQSKISQSVRAKIGILYVKQGQNSEEEVFGNEYGSEEFEAFLELLGEIIELEGWQGFKGDLDVVHNRTGTHSLFTQFKGVDIMFHVSTLLPHSNEDEQQIAKKRCIGNDLTTIIFLEKGAVFKPPCVSGDFLQVFAAVQPSVARDGTPGFRVAVSRRTEVPHFGPSLPQPAFVTAADQCRDFLLTKLINGERASLNSAYISSKMASTRMAYLQGLTKEYSSSLMRLSLDPSTLDQSAPDAPIQRSSSPGFLVNQQMSSSGSKLKSSTGSKTPSTSRSGTPFGSSEIPESPLSKDPAEWSISDCASWLESVELEEVRSVFIENSISGSELLDLTEDDMKSMGITKLGPRKKLLKRIAALRGECNSLTSSTNNASNVDSSEITESPEDTRFSIKLCFKEDWYSIKITGATTFKSLRRQLEDQFECRLRIKYSDPDGDQIAIKRESDWQECLEEGAHKRRIKLYLSERDATASASSSSPIEKSLTAQARSEMFGMFETILDPVIIISETGVVQYANKKVEPVLGYSPAELIGCNVNAIMPQDVKPYHDNFLRNYLQTGVSRIIGRGRDVIAVKKDGSICPLLLEVSENSLGSGKLYFVGVLKESRARPQVKSILQQEREVLDTLIVPAIIIDSMGLINGFNKAAQDFLGYSLVDVIGKNVNLMMPSPHKEHHDSYLKAYLATGEAKIIGIGRRLVAQHRDGSLLPIFLTVTEKRDAEKVFFTGLLQEVQAAAVRAHISSKTA